MMIKIVDIKLCFEKIYGLRIDCERLEKSHDLHRSSFVRLKLLGSALLNFYGILQLDYLRLGEVLRGFNS